MVGGREARSASELLGPNGPADLKAWLKYLHSHGPSMFDKDGFLKQPGTFSRGCNNLISGVVYDDGVSGKVAEARVQQEDRRAEALRQRRMMLARRGRMCGLAERVTGWRRREEGRWGETTSPGEQGLSAACRKGLRK